MVGVRQFDEDEVITTALDVFWRKGLHDATMQDLAAATGVQRGSLYNAYGDKEAIFLRAFDRYTEQFLEVAGNALSHGDAAAGLRNFFDMIIVSRAPLATAMRAIRLNNQSGTATPDAATTSSSGPED